MKYRWLMILVFVAVLAAGPALASERFCIRFESIDPSAPEPNHPQCESNSTFGYEYHHLVSRELQGGIPGQIQHNQVIITREWDSLTPFLWQRLDNGVVIPRVAFEFVEDPQLPDPPYIKIELTNVYLLAIEPLIPNTREANSYGNQSRIRMSYETMSIRYDREDPVILQAPGSGH